VKNLWGPARMFLRDPLWLSTGLIIKQLNIRIKLVRTNLIFGEKMQNTARVKEVNCHRNFIELFLQLFHSTFLLADLITMTFARMMTPPTTRTTMTNCMPAA